MPQQPNIQFDDGTPPHRFALPQYLLVARALLVEPELSTFSATAIAAAAAPNATLDTALAAAEAAAGGRSSSSSITTAAWWAARTVLLQQRLLAKRSPSLRASLLPLFARTLRSFDAPPPTAVSASLWSQVRSQRSRTAALYWKRTQSINYHGSAISCLFWQSLCKIKTHGCRASPLASARVRSQCVGSARCSLT